MQFSCEKKKRERNSKPSVAEEAGPPISFPVADKNNFCLLSIHSAFVSSSSHSASCRHSSLMLATFDTAANDSSAWNAALTVLLHFEFFFKNPKQFQIIAKFKTARLPCSSISRTIRWPISFIFKSKIIQMRCKWAGSKWENGQPTPIKCHQSGQGQHWPVHLHAFSSFWDE